MIPHNRLLRVVALPAFEDLPAQVVFGRKYGEWWYVRVSVASEQQLARIMRELPDIDVDAEELEVAVTILVDPEHKAQAGADRAQDRPPLATDVRARRN